MKRSFKIILIVSLLTNIIIIGIQLVYYFRNKDNKETIYPRKSQKIVNPPIAKKNFLDSLFISYPELKAKKYLFLHIYSTHHYWCTKPLPIYDTIITPLKPDVGYVLVNDEKEKYTKKVLKDDSASTKNFLYAYNSEDFILALNQELNFKYSRFHYPKYPMSVIIENNGKILFFDTIGISGPRFPEDSLKDKKSHARIKQALNELK